MINNGHHNGHERTIDPFDVLTAIWEGDYDLDRPSSQVIPELIEVLKCLDCRVGELEDEQDKKEETV